LSRLDKYLWCIRLFRSREKAAEACRGGRVQINDRPGKPSSTVKPGDAISARLEKLSRRGIVVDLPRQRVGAPRVEEFWTDLTPESEWAKLKQPALTDELRHEGRGRPTKKDRRLMQAHEDQLQQSAES
jgi:ribosome-associated heat shock protein Hsp15